MINYLKSLIYTISIIIIGTIIITLFNYFNILNGLAYKTVTLILPSIAIIIGSFILGKKSNHKGYIEGLKYGLLWSVLLSIINIIIKNFNVTSIIYYVVVTLISVLAASIGINCKNKQR